MSPSLALNQQVKVVKGKHKGKTGNVTFYQIEGDGGRITLLLSDGKTIYVDKDEIDFKFEWVYIDVMVGEAERAYIKELARCMRDGECHS